MKKARYIVLAVLLAMTMIAVTACGGSLSADTGNEKSMVITADKATEDHQITTGSLEVGEGEKVEARADLEQGEIKIEIMAMGEDESADELPDLDAEAVFVANLSRSDAQAADFEPGSYRVRITPAEKATGTVTIDVLPAE